MGGGEFGRLLVRDVHFSIAARRGRIDSFNDALNVGSKSRPLLLAENHNSDFAAGKILLIADVLNRS
jgi:hypothetical protein